MRIAAIHGIGNRFEGSETTKAAWLPALNSGLREAGYPLIREEDYTSIFFGSIFRPPGSARGRAAKLEALDEEYATNILLEFWREAARLSEQNRSGSDPNGEALNIQPVEEFPAEIGTRGRAPGTLQAALRQLSKSRFFKSLGPERFLLADLGEVRRYLHEPSIKAAVLERFEKAIPAGVQILIGHSLGSVVAYEALCRHPEWKVDTYVSIGSPLGIRNLVFDALTPTPINGKGIRPSVRRWVNIADDGDIVALEKSLGKFFPGVEDFRVYNGWQSHSALRYLTAKETGAAIGAALAR